jgi:hypothetical protein
LKNVGLDLSPQQGVSVHVGEALDFTSMIESFEKQHPHLLSFKDPHAMGGPDYMCPEKRKLYRDITEIIRKEVLRCHEIARANRK